MDYLIFGYATICYPLQKYVSLLIRITRYYVATTKAVQIGGRWEQSPSNLPENILDQVDFWQSGLFFEE